MYMGYENMTYLKDRWFNKLIKFGKISNRMEMNHQNMKSLGIFIIFRLFRNILRIEINVFNTSQNRSSIMD